MAASDYQRDLARVNAGILQLDAAVRSRRADVESTTVHAWRLYRRASLTGDDADLETVKSAIEQALARFSQWPDLWLLHAKLAFKCHRHQAVRDHLGAVEGLASGQWARALLADVDVEEGRFTEAESAYRGLLEEERTWDNLARLANLRGRLGDLEGGEGLYLAAAEEITAKEMRGYAWVQLQRGRLRLDHGDSDAAAGHFSRAARTFSGWWVVDAHLAELALAQGDLDDALARYLTVADAVPRPSLRHAVGDVYARIGRTREAGVCHARALVEYLRAVGRGHLHHAGRLSDLYGDSLGDAVEALRWADRDVELRRGPATLARRAWRLYRVGRLPEAADAMNEALSTGVIDAETLERAAAIGQALAPDHAGGMS